LSDVIDRCAEIVQSVDDCDEPCLVGDMGNEVSTGRVLVPLVDEVIERSDECAFGSANDGDHVHEASG
jgi:hypothetical protein